MFPSRQHDVAWRIKKDGIDVMQIDVLKRADWLDEERVIGYSRMFAFLYLAMAVGWIALSPNLIDPNGKPIGTDFMNVWAAGRLVLDGDPGAAYDYGRHYEVQARALPYADGQATPYFGWHYPPYFLLAAAVLASIPYGWALAAWMAATLPVYAAAVKAILPHRRWLLITLAFPAVFVNLAHGQNGFLSAGLLGLGMLWLERRPIVAGVFFGLLAYKPQLGALLPLALLVDRRWAAFVAAAATVLLLSLVSYALLGGEAWRAFFASLELTRTYVLEQGPTGWEKLQSTFAAMRMLGAGVSASYAVHGLISVVAGAAVLWIWHRPVAMPLKGAALATGCLLVTPYVLDYDLMLLALPIAWLAAEGLRTQFLNWEKLLLLVAWLLPLISRGIATLGLPIAPFVLLLLLGLIAKRAALRDASRHGVYAQPI
jgi:hypothetical protein